MSVEALILGRDESLAHHSRNILIRDQHSSLLTDLCNERTAAGVDAQWHRQAVAGHRSDIWQRRLEIKVASAVDVNALVAEAQAISRQSHHSLPEVLRRVHGVMKDDDATAPDVAIRHQTVPSP